MAFQTEQSHIKEVVKLSTVTRSPASGKGPKKRPGRQKKLWNFCEIPACSLLKAFYFKLERPRKQEWLPHDCELWFLGKSVKTTHRVHDPCVTHQVSHRLRAIS